MANSDARKQELSAWLLHDLGLSEPRLVLAASDASFRRYWRASHAGGSHIVMDAPPETERTEPFVRIAELFREAGLRTPRVYARNAARGFLLLEDFGDLNLLRAAGPDNADGLYRRALDALVLLQLNLPVAALDLPVYDAALLHRELDIFGEWFLAGLLGMDWPAGMREPVYRFLTDSALAQPRVCVHRDFHSRNLMAPDAGPLGVLDFQDAVAGPLTYDVVSLLRDCYVAWPEARVAAWLRYFQQRSPLAGQVDWAVFSRWFDLMGMQRHLKAIGIFARLYLRDGKPGYLPDIPRTFDYVARVAADYPDLAGFADFLRQAVAPRLADLRLPGRLDG